ncbi:MAG TPA: glycosyltransferase family 2 protein, partial [bacterium]|nr:glycosyltransferase family 2 protein [bacterium]
MVPALNESENLAKILDNIITNLSENNVKFELILINDGSSDNTGEIMDNFKNQYPEKIKVIHHQTNRGLGRSFREALNIAENECFTWFPSDGENDINDLIKYLPLLNYVDIIIPFAVNKGVRSIFRRILSSCYLMIINITFGTMFNYTNGNVIYKKKFLKKLRLTSNSFFFQTEALIKATRLNRNEIMFAEVPIILKKRASGKSQAFRLNNVINIFIDYL